MKYGLPNYGETPKQDQKITVPIVHLNRAVNVCAPKSEINSEAVPNVKEVQLIFMKGSARPWYNQRVVVSGTLILGHTGQHSTQVVMVVRTITTAQE
jgi:hypothetical protein